MMNTATRTQVWDRAEGHCEYCRIHQDHVELRHHIELRSMNAGQRLQLRAALIAHGLFP